MTHNSPLPTHKKTLSLKHRHTESGNILIYILGAIFLLGILVVMVRGSSTPGSNIDREALLLRVSEVQQYGQELERAVAYVLRNGYSEEDLRFAYPDADPAYGDITDDPARQVFATAGGGATYRSPPEGTQAIITPWLFSAGNSVGTVGSGNCTTDPCVDLVMMLNNVTKEFCVEINNKSDVENPGGNPVLDEGGINDSIFSGSYTWASRIREANPVTIIANTPEACFQTNGGNFPVGSYHYYRVLLAR